MNKSKPKARISDEELQRRYEAYLQYGTFNKTAKALNLDKGAIRSAVYRVKGICSCGKPIDKANSNTMCAECLAKNRERLKLRNEGYYENRICVYCGKNPVAKGNKRYCSECSSKRRTSYKHRKKYKVENGICLACSNPALPDKLYCQYHQDKIKEVNYENKLKNNFDGLRKVVLDRDNWTCQCCGYHGTETKIKGGTWLEVHHLYSRKNELSNLITLCNKCHRAITYIYTHNNVNAVIDFYEKHYASLLRDWHDT